MQYGNEANPIRKAEMHLPDPYDYEQRLAAVFGDSGRFANWTGIVRFNVEGARVYVAFYPDCSDTPQAIQLATAHFNPTEDKCSCANTMDF